MWIDAMEPQHVTDSRCLCTTLSGRSGGNLREQFPLLSEAADGKRLVYLDSASTAQKPRALIEAELRFATNRNATVHRGVYALSESATAAFEEGRRRVAQFVNAEGPECVVVTRSATGSLNGLARGLEHGLKAGDEILLTEMEHHANLVPWQMLAKRRGVHLRYIPFDENGELNLDSLPELLTARTRIVSLTLLSNVLGTLNPVAAISEAARCVGARVIVDAAQAVGHRPLDFQALGADYVVFSAHKAYGPGGLGFLVGSRDALEWLEPFEGGGQMIESVTLDEVRVAAIPTRFEAGTPNVQALATFPASLDLLESVGLPEIERHERELTGYALDRLASLGGLRIVGPRDPQKRGGLVSFVDERVHAQDLALLLDEQGVAIRVGHHCAQPLHARLGLPATARASFGIYSERDDVDALINGIRFARSFMT